MAEQNYVELRHVNKKYKDFQASDDINFGIGKGKLIGLLGPSGSGKTTILRMLAGLEHADSGEIIIDGRVVNDVPASERGIGFVFQNYALFRYMTVYDNIAFGLDVKKWKKADIRRRVDELVELVGLKGFEKRYPNQLSGGQRQRIGIARALAVNPEFIIADEPVSALDVSIQAQILNLLMDLKDEFNFSYLFIAHDLSVVRHISDRLGVMYLGSIVEMGDKHTLFTNPVHPYTKVLFAAVPTVGEKPLVQGIDAKGEIPSPVNLPKGCYFSDRCPYATDRCRQEKPVLREVEPGHMAACHLL